MRLTRDEHGRQRIQFTDRHGRDRYVYLYRLNAVAWGILDGLGDPRLIHHKNGQCDDDTEPNLEAVWPEDHPRCERGRWR